MNWKVFESLSWERAALWDTSIGSLISPTSRAMLVPATCGNGDTLKKARAARFHEKRVSFKNELETWPISPSATNRGSRGRSSVPTAEPRLLPEMMPPMSACAAPTSLMLLKR